MTADALEKALTELNRLRADASDVGRARPRRGTDLDWLSAVPVEAEDGTRFAI
jgi:hypothetical protein